MTQFFKDAGPPTVAGQLEKILNAAPAAIASFLLFEDRHWVYEYWSRGCEPLFGYSCEELLGDAQLWPSRVVSEDWQQSLLPLMEAFFAEQPATAEYRFQTKTGEMRWIASTYHSEKVDDTCWRVVAVNVDISDRKRSEAERQGVEAALRESEAQFRTVFNSAGIGIVVGIPPAFTCGICNAAFESIVGYTAEELAKISFATLTYAEDLLVEEKLIQACLSGSRDSYQLEKRYLHKKGHLVWVNLVVSVALRDDQGQVQMMIASIQDISDRKNSETERRAAQAALQQQVMRERLVTGITQHIRQTLDLEDLLQRAVDQVRQVVRCDRVILFRLQGTGQGKVIAESVESPWTAILSTTIQDPCFTERYVDSYRQGRVGTMVDISAADVTPCYAELLTTFQVKANLVVPVRQGTHLWGLLIAHQCERPRVWNGEEIELLRQLADQLGIAIQQAELHQQTRSELQKRRKMQAALQASKERFRSLSASAPIGICQTNADGICLYVNHYWQEISGLSLEASLGDGWLQAIHPEDRPAQQAAWEAFLRGDRPFAEEFRLMRPDHQIYWVSAQSAPMYDLNGEVVGYVTTQTDITKRKQYEQQLNLLKQAIVNVAEAVLITRFEPTAANRHPIVFVNPAFVDMTGYGLEEILGRNPRFLQGPQTDPEALARVRQALDDQLPLQIEILNYRKAGTEFWVGLSLVPITNDQGQVTHWVSVRRDISDRKRAEQKITEQAALINIASDAIFVRDLDKRIVFWSAGAERLYGWTAAEVLGQNADTLFVKEDPDQLAAGLAILLEQGTWQGELHQLTKTGQELIVASRWTLLQDAFNQPFSILEVNTDITEKKQLEQQFYRAQRLESIGVLASGIAHDLNNIFTPILTISQMLPLKHQDLDERSLEMLKLIESSTKRGANLVKQILVFARGTTGKHIPVQAGHLLLEVVRIAQQTFPKAITLSVDVPVRSLWPVLADSTQIQQVFMNLCVNARDAMPNGGTLTLTAENRTLDDAFARIYLDARPGNFVCITIADTGVGIAPNLIDRIFDPFFTTKPVGEGTGLGLSTVLGLVKSHEGFVLVSSQVGQGTQFQVYLPTAETPALPEEPPITSLQGNQEWVLVVDDEPAIRQTHQLLLESYGYRTFDASDGAAAVDCYTHHADEIDLVLVDIMMPNQDGLTAIRALKQIAPHLPIIAMSGLPSNKPTALAAGADRFLAKPCLPSDLLAVCRQLLNQKT